MSDWTRVENDTGPPIKDTLETDGSADDLTGATVAFTLWDPSDGTVKIDENTSNVTFTTDGSDGKVEYEFAADDLDTVGVYAVEWEVTFADGTVVTYRRENGDPKELRVRSEGA